MKTLLLFVALAAAALSADEPQPEKLTEVEILRLENLALREAALKRDAVEIGKARQELVVGACKRAGVDLSECQIQPDGSITKKPKEATTK